MKNAHLTAKCYTTVICVHVSMNALYNACSANDNEFFKANDDFSTNLHIYNTIIVN